MSGVERVLTERMVLERLRPRHHPELAVLLGDPRVAGTLWPGQETPSEAQLMHSLLDKLDHWDRYGFGLWLARARDSGAVLGRGGLQHTQVSGEDEVEAGWAIAPERWGQGLGTELARASLEVAFDTLHFPAVIALALPTNIGSRRVMEKAGFMQERSVYYHGLAHVVYRVQRRAPADAANAIRP